MSMDLFGVSSLPCDGGYVYFLAHCTWGCVQTLLENWAWPPRGLPVSQEHTEHVSNCAVEARVFCSHHGASSVSAACPRGAREVISENPSQLLELTQRTHSTAEIPAGLGQAQRCCQENDSISADTVLAEGGLWRIAYRKSEKLSKQYLCRRRKGKGNVSFA